MTESINDEVVAAWDTISAAYHDRYDIPSAGVHLGPMVPEPSAIGLDLAIAGRDVLDFGCGGGENAVACALAGAASVTGVDPSEAQLDRARRLARRSQVAVRFHNLREGGMRSFSEDFDLVISVYAMQFVADLPTVLRDIASRTRPGGMLVLSVDHPVRLSGEWHDDEFVVEDYFAHGWQTWPYDFPEAGIQVTMRRYRRTTEEWVTTLLAANFVLRGLYEPLPPQTPDSFGLKSKYGTDDPRNVFAAQKLRRVPGSLILAAERSP
jgi:2-polyprenyl-3-methyl-5-hydroxy-6-metoxy-1,4-benzoquinol methylase